ncbi:hypothetical protein G7Y89_g3069 [Cudoniella acicularis]|uniref:Sec39 domain-containing protein n=1 Tax=Cudoniella acicularis TaxID=354080 RepID=A0A8H4RU16_9HELO|nr:hypothetical protein G7Y89_g3069 [Cudoniella acicularis]
MAGSEVSAAKAILLAVQLASKSDIPALETLVSRHRKTLHLEIVLRILLSHLPESLDSSDYVPFLSRLFSGTLVEDPNFSPTSEVLDDLDESEAKKKARKLHLLPLTWPYDTDKSPDCLVCFLVLRSLRIDENTGLIAQLPGLLRPFLHQSTFLRTWMISTVLPLLRFNYEYHPEIAVFLTIPNFEKLDDQAGVKLLLSQTGKDTKNNEATVGRDLRGLVGAWMYGDTRWKRRKSRIDSQAALQTITPLDEAHAVNEKCVGWEEVFKWIVEQAGTSWKTAVEAVEQWDGPGDVDLGEYGNGTVWLDEGEQQHLERRYARAAIASAYIIYEDSEDALNGIYRILSRIVTLFDHDRIPTLQSSAQLLAPVLGLDESLLSKKTTFHMRNGLLDEQNPLTSAKAGSVRFLQALLISAFLCTKFGFNSTVRKMGELALLQDEREQQLEFTKLMLHVGNGPKGDDKYWVRKRNELLWLRSWGTEELSEGADATTGRGIFGALAKDYVEAELLKILLTNTRYTLARSIYESSPDRPLSKQLLVDTIISAAMNAYDNATNANKTRGGVKRCHDILQAFPNSLSDSLACNQLENLISVTHLLGEYRLVFKQGEPFKPVTLRVHGDPISIIGKVLEQNPKTYTKINNLLDIGRLMVKAGLTVRDIGGHTKFSTPEHLTEQIPIAEKRIVSMCVDAALAEDDFETAYSYVITRLKNIAGPSHARSPDIERTQSGLIAEVPPKVIDDWSWRAALQAGKYRRTKFTVKPTHLGNASGNLEIRHLEQRMECLSQALRLAPKATLQEILNVYRRCEEELETQVRLEAEQEAAWDAQGDDQAMPGGFGAASSKQNATESSTSRAAEEAPLSLFDLSRASMARAQSGFSALSMLRSNTSDSKRPVSGSSFGGSDGSKDGASESGTPKPSMRKRDQLKNAAVGGLASGIGWLINAPAVNTNQEEHDER